jgi:hypothetical protein
MAERAKAEVVVAIDGASHAVFASQPGRGRRGHPARRSASRLKQARTKLSGPASCLDPGVDSPIMSMIMSTGRIVHDRLPGFDCTRQQVREAALRASTAWRCLSAGPVRRLGLPEDSGGAGDVPRRGNADFTFGPMPQADPALKA